MAKKKPGTGWKQTRLVDPKRKDADVGMFETVEVPEHELQAVIAFLEAESVANSSIEWVERMQRALEPAFGPKAKPSDSVISETGREVYQLAESILDPLFAKQPLAVIVRRCYLMGRSHERLVLTASFDERVARSRKNSLARKKVAEARQTLDEKQWKAVIKFVDDRAQGLSAAAAYREASVALRTGTFRKLPGVCVEIGPDRIKQKHTAKR